MVLDLTLHGTLYTNIGWQNLIIDFKGGLIIFYLIQIENFTVIY